MKKTLVALFSAVIFACAASAQTSLSEVEDLYMVGDPTQWSFLQLIKSSDQVWFYEGNITGSEAGGESGRFRAAPAASWDNPIHATANGTVANPDGTLYNVEYNNMAGGDKNWVIDKTGKYRIVFDLQASQMSVTQNFSEVLPVITPSVYAVGGATIGEWDTAQGTPLTVDASNPYIFTYQTYIKSGDCKFKFSLRNDKGWDGNWIHPAQSVSFGTDGLANCPIEVFRGADIHNNDWTVTEAGTYKITLDLRNMEMSAEYISDKVVSDQLYIVGDLTGWAFYPMDKVAPNVFEFTFDNCNSGQRFRASLAPVWGNHLRPEADNSELAIDNKDGLDVKADQTNDYNWVTKEPGNYKIRFDLNTMKVSTNKDNTSTSLEEITTANNEETPEYFTLQGIRIENITVGGIYIQKTGSSVKKVIIR